MPVISFQSHSLELILLVSSVLLIISVLASRITSSFGIPSLLLFLCIGMVAGSEGPGEIEFNNYPLAYAIGSVCLAMIIFDGGVRTSWKSVRPILPLGISLSFFGTVVTGIVTAIFAHLALGLTPIEGAILGAIVSSTDAAAVFGILRARSLTLRGSLKETLEFEAGSNDPVAVFLTVSVLIFASQTENNVSSFVKLFLFQSGIGLLMGWVGGKFIRWLINHVGIAYEGLYGVLLIGLILCLWASTSAMGGSGFLAVFVAGFYLGNADFLHKGSIIRFLDGIAWIAQIVVFLTLGLLVFPSHLLPIWKEGLFLSLFMMFVARPISVFSAAPGKVLKGPERIFVSWVGLRGAAPIILATLPWSFGFSNSEYIFNLVFFVVLTSVVVQGISIAFVATKLGIIEPIREESSKDQILGLLPEGFVSIEFEVTDDSPAKDQRIVDLKLPAGLLLTSLQRESRFIIPRGDTVILAGDRIRALARPSNREALTALFGTISFDTMPTK